MLRLLADENFNGIVFDELLRQAPDLDLVRAQDVGLTQMADPLVLAWAADEGRVLLTHDKKTVPRHFHQRVIGGPPVAGVIELLPPYSVPQAVQDILIAVQALSPEEMRDRILYLPCEVAGGVLKREFAGEKNVLTTRIQSLDQTGKDQAEQIARLLGQAEKAYGQVQEIAVRAIEGSAGAKQLASFQQMVADQGRRPPAER